MDRLEPLPRHSTTEPDSAADIQSGDCGEPGDCGERAVHTRPGLHARMQLEKRRISSQHEQLNEFYALVQRQLTAGAVHAARESFYRFQDALTAHLSVEEELYFPALRTLRPPLAPRLRQLEAEHVDIRDQLNEIRALLEVNERELSTARLEALAEGLSAHEQREEQLLSQLESD